METRHPWRALVVLLVGQSVVLLDTTVVNVAIPNMIASLHASIDAILWVTNGYVLVYAALIITGGRLGDIYGQRRLYLTGLAVFVVASAFCGAAQNPGQLIAARVMQGIGAALLTPQSLAIIVHIFPVDRRPAALSVWGAVAGMAGAVGPTVGGLLVAALDWRWIFYVNLPIGIGAFCLSLAWLPTAKSSGKTQPLDLVGTALVTSGLLLISYGLIEGEPHHWGRVWGPITIPMMFVAGAIVLGLFVLYERGRQERGPLLPFEILQDRNFRLMSVAVAALPWAFGALLFLTLFHLQLGLGMSARDAGLTMAVAPLVSGLVAMRSGRLIDRYGGKRMLLVGFGLLALGIAAVAVAVRPGGGWWHLLPGLVIVGFGMGVGGSPAAIIAMHNIAATVRGAASGVFNMTRLSGTLLGGAAVGALLQVRLDAAGIHPDVLQAGIVQAELRQGFTESLQLTYLMPIAALVAGILLTLGVRPYEQVEVATVVAVPATDRGGTQ